MQRDLASRWAPCGGRAAGAAVLIVCFAALSGCAHAPHPQEPQPPTPTEPAPPPPATQPPPPPAPPPEEPTPPPVKRVLEGIASWYGPRFDGRTTASGERFDEDALTAAAHATLALGSRVRVTNLRNGRSVVVRINDRGPRYRNRLIDLSRGAAVALGMIRPGTAPVRVEVLNDRAPAGERPLSPAPSGRSPG